MAQFSAQMSIARTTMVRLIDCPVSGEIPKAATGDLMILAGGLDASCTVLDRYKLYALRTIRVPR